MIFSYSSGRVLSDNAENSHEKNHHFSMAHYSRFTWKIQPHLVVHGIEAILPLIIDKDGA